MDKKRNIPNLNILINNAGIQRGIDFRKGIDALTTIDNEIAINLEAPIQLCAYFIPLLQTQKESAIINVTSGLGFIPSVAMPVYSATKAALHSFTVSLRRQLQDTSIKVFEIIPPMVDTDLDKGERKKEVLLILALPRNRPQKNPSKQFKKMNTNSLSVKLRISEQVQSKTSKNTSTV